MSKAGRVLLSLLWASWLSIACAGDQEDYRLPVSQAADYSTILANKSDKTTVFDYQGRSLILVIDFPTLVEQGQMFNRVVALIERIGAPRERVLNNEELAQYIRSVGKTGATLAYGNDFLVSELVIFFNLADMGGILLSTQELALRQLLIDKHLIVHRNGFYQAVVPQAVILSLPQESMGNAANPAVAPQARKTILMHEISHAEFYTNPLYAGHCRRFWKEAMNAEQRAAFRKFLSGSNYNPENEEMMINETQAYLFYTPDPRAFNAKLVGLKEREIAELRTRFVATFPDAPLAELREQGK